MTDELRNRLERLGERAPERPDAFERLRDARERRDRRRARSALAVGLSVVVVGALAVVMTLRDDPVAPVPGESPTGGAEWEVPEQPYLWPENWARAEDRQKLASVQQRADLGDEAVGWRVDPKEVVERFLSTVLAWEEPRVEETDLLADGAVFVASPRCEGNAVACDRGTLLVVVDQPSRRGDGGVWNVTSVASDPLQVRGPLGLAPALLAESQVGFELTLPESRSAHAGIVASNGCRETSEFALALESGTSSLQVPAAEVEDPSCGEIGAGYLFVYAMDDTTVPTGDPLLESAAIEFPWLTMLPVEVQMSAAEDDEPVPTVAVIECSGPGVAGTNVLTPVVATQADGVHVEVRNTSNVDLGISFATRGDDADVGTTELVLDSAPGDEDALCTGADTDRGDGGVPFEIVDPQGHWVSTELDGETCRSMSIDYVEVPTGIADPIEAARDHLGDRVEEGDELVLAGYPEASVEKIVVLRRAGVPIASVAMFEGTRGWYADTVTTCG